MGQSDENLHREEVSFENFDFQRKQWVLEPAAFFISYCPPSHRESHSRDRKYTVRSAAAKSSLRDLAHWRVRSPALVRRLDFCRMYEKTQASRAHPASPMPCPRDAGRSCALLLTEASADRPLGIPSDSDFRRPVLGLRPMAVHYRGPAQQICALPIKKDFSEENRVCQVRHRDCARSED